MKKVVTTSLVVALAGFLFGFDTIVISGADLPIQELWDTSPWVHSTLIMSMALWGTVIGALFGAIPCNRYGRKKTLFWIGVLFFISAVGSAMATGPYLFSFFRFIGGLGVGASSVAAPIYISEISPAKSRGRLVILYQVFLVLGILIAYLSNYLIGSLIEEHSWRYMLGAEAIPALLYTLLVINIPNSPRWVLVRQNDESKARSILAQLNPKTNLDKAIDMIRKSVKDVGSGSWAEFRSGRYKLPIMLAFLLAAFNQLSGINFVLYYAPRIFKEAGLSVENILGASIPIGIVNLVMTLVGVYLIDRVGRRKLMIIGSIGYILSLLAVSWAFHSQAQGTLVVVFVCVFIASHAIGQGAVIWVFISEIFPNAVRDYGMSLGSGTHWVFAAIITMVTLPVLQAFSGASIFVFFALMMVLQLLYVIFLMPETKGVSLEDLQNKLLKK